MADGTVTFETKLDTAGIKSGLNGLQSMISRWASKASSDMALIADVDTVSASAQLSRFEKAADGAGDEAVEAKESVDELADGIADVGGEAQQAGDDIDGLKGKMKGLGDGADDAKKKVNGLGKLLGENPVKSFSTGLSKGAKELVKDFAPLALGYKAVTKAAEGLWAATKAGVEYNAQMEAYQTNFAVLLGDEAAALEHVAQMREMAAKTPFGMEDLASANQTLLSFGMSAERSMEVMQQLGDISLGNKERFSSLSLAFAQVSSAGKLTGQDLLQINDCLAA